MSERYGVADDDVDMERGRLAMLARTLDPGTFRDAATALEQMRARGFAMLGPTSIATTGRKPTQRWEQP